MLRNQCGFAMCWLIVCGILMGLTAARSALYSEESPSSIREEQCHDGCIKKFVTDDISCLQEPECQTCWDDCSSATTVNRAVPATWPLSVTSMVRDGSLVAANVAWHAEPLAPKTPCDCLVTWEVSGGGLIGNLLTQTSFVELSLWPDTKYRVQVTCKTKNTEELSRSVPLSLDTSAALVIVRIPTLAPPSTAHRHNTNAVDTSDDSDSTNSIQQQQHSTRYAATYMLFDQSTSSLSTAFSWSRLYAHSGLELALGCLAAIIVFAAVVAAFVVSRRKSRQAAALVDKTPLVDNEVAVHVDGDRLTIHV